MNRTYSALGSFVGRWCRPVVEAGGLRRMCTKPVPPPATETPAHAPRPAFKIPGYRPTELDKKTLIWSGRFKTREEIPETVSFEMLDAARNRLRVKVCYVMIGLTIVACIVMIIQGKKSILNHESLTTQNMEKKAKWREEYLREKEEAAAAAALAKAE